MWRPTPLEAENASVRIDITFDPIIAQLGAFQLGWHGLFTAVAVLAGIWLGSRRAERWGFSADGVGTVVIWSIVGGLIGARAFHVLDHLSYYAEHPLEAFAVWEGGIAVYGSFIGGILGGLIGVRQTGLPAWPLLDAAAPAMLLGQAIGRLGCLSNGDAWGAPTGTNWGVVYWHPNDLLPRDLIGVSTHPYPLYEIVAVLAVMLGLWWWERRQPVHDGSLFLVAALGYAVVRFGLTYFRQETILAWGLQEAQVIALATVVVIAGIALARRTARTSARVETTNVGA